MSMPAELLNTQPRLSDLLDGIAEAPALPIDGIALDSRRLDKGFLFLACAGASNHGLDFCDQAVRAGAIAIVFDSSTARSVPGSVGMPMIPVEGLANKVGEIANRFFDYPSTKLQVIAVTGTNGKSTVAWLVAQCLDLLGRSSAYAGTLGYGVGEVRSDDHMTSPDVVEMHRRLAGFVDAGAKYAAIEVSSHALDQKRVDGVAFDTTMFTNLSRDHLDYHGDMRSYGDVKARLFVDHPAERRIINLDSEFGEDLASRCEGNVITVSTNFDRVANGRPHVFAQSILANENGSEVSVQSAWGDARFDLPLVGEFNVANSLLALAYLLSIDIPIADACNVLAEVSAPPGRMQPVSAGTGPTAFIDYAHTPDALDVTLRALRPHTRGNLWCVFGCGGDRDAGKRPEMGRVAESLADAIVLTNDNPRSEEPAAIIDDIVAGLSDASAANIIEDRAAAIAWAIANAELNDAILIAGKGHEDYQLIGDDRRNFSDYSVAAANLEAILGEAKI
jgi:UDP-N-acetylmuramoyl-L-alanyl-D-glutamate--2,6-diaminopimelate ligase